VARELTADDALFQLSRLRTCRACGHDLITQHDPSDETCDAFSGDLDVGVCRCGRDSVTDGTGRKLSPLERLRRAEKEERRLQGLSVVLSDLDRCEHGRHEGDVCGGATGCNGPSHGNPFVTDRRIGTGLGQRPIVIPERGKGYVAEDWYGS
jgi:hypothetical protein